MKKLFVLLLAIACVAAPKAWSAAGSEEAPLSVTELLEQGVPSEAVPDTYVQGYIVGCLDKVFGVYQPKWDVPSAPVTNLLLAATADVRDVARCITVNLPKGEVRDAISLYVIGNLGRKVVVRGSNELYLEYNGIKGTDWYKFIEDEDPDNPVTPDDPDVITIFESLQEDAWTMDPYWTEDVVKMPASMSYVWRWKSVDGKNFMNASGYVDGVDNETESWLIAKNSFNLTGYESVSLCFEHAAKFQTTLRDLCGFYVREAGTEEWDKIDIPEWPVAGGWSFVNSGAIDLSAYIGKNIQIALLYRSTADGADNWEVKNLTMKGKVDGSALKPAGLSWSAATAVAVAGEAFEAPVLSFDTTAPISYSSSDLKVASVNAEGKVTAFAEGTTEIKASSPANGEYEAGEATYVLTVEMSENQPEDFGLLLDWDSATCDWTFENKSLAPGLEYVWSWAYYQEGGFHYLKGNAFVGNTPYEAVAYAISPVVSLEGYTGVTVSFEHAAKFQTNLAMLSSFLVREEGAEEWTRLHITNWPEPGSWAYTNSGKADISDFDGKRVQFAFQYGSNEYKADTWQIRNLRLSGVPAPGGSGIRDVEAEALGYARWYDLSGRPVPSAPERGMYIKVVDGKAVKVAVK